MRSSDGALPPAKIRISHDWMLSLGLDRRVPPRMAEQLSRFVMDYLETEVGRELVRQLRDDDVARLKAFLGSGNHDEARSWLAKTVPRYPDLVAEQHHALEERLRSSMALLNEDLLQRARGCGGIG